MMSQTGDRSGRVDSKSKALAALRCRWRRRRAVKAVDPTRAVNGSFRLISSTIDDTLIKRVGYSLAIDRYFTGGGVRAARDGGVRARDGGRRGRASSEQLVLS